MRSYVSLSFENISQRAYLKIYRNSFASVSSSGSINFKSIALPSSVIFIRKTHKTEKQRLSIFKFEYFRSHLARNSSMKSSQAILNLSAHSTSTCYFYISSFTPSKFNWFYRNTIELYKLLLNYLSCTNELTKESKLNPANRSNYLASMTKICASTSTDYGKCILPYLSDVPFYCWQKREPSKLSLLARFAAWGLSEVS